MLGSVFYFQDDSKELLEKLKKDFKQYIVTNGVEDTQRRKLKLSGITDLVDDIFISECIGYEKPNPMFFEGCMKGIEKRIHSYSDGGFFRSSIFAQIQACAHSYFERGNAA